MRYVATKVDLSKASQILLPSSWIIIYLNDSFQKFVFTEKLYHQVEGQNYELFLVTGKRAGGEQRGFKSKTTKETCEKTRFWPLFGENIYLSKERGLLFEYTKTQKIKMFKGVGVYRGCVVVMV